MPPSPDSLLRTTVCTKLDLAKDLTDNHFGTLKRRESREGTRSKYSTGSRGQSERKCMHSHEWHGHYIMRSTLHLHITQHRQNLASQQKSTLYLRLLLSYTLEYPIPPSPVFSTTFVLPTDLSIPLNLCVCPPILLFVSGSTSKNSKASGLPFHAATGLWWVSNIMTMRKSSDSVTIVIGRASHSQRMLTPIR